MLTNHNRLLIACAGALAFLVAGADALLAAEPAALPARAVIQFTGQSTLHDFHGHVTSQFFTLVLPPAGAAGPSTWSGHAAVPVGQMTTAHAKRDRNMYDLLAEKAFPRITATVTNAPLPNVTNSTVQMTLTIRDVTRVVPVQITEWHRTAQGVSFHAAFAVSLKEYGMKPPSVLGLIRVADTVQLTADITAPVPEEKP